MFLKHPRGAVFWAQAPKNTQGSVQEGARPVVVVSNNTNNIHSEVVTVVSITSQEKPNLPTHVIIPAVKGDGINTVLCEQIRTMPKDALDRYCGILTEDVMHSIDKALMIHLGIDSKIQDSTPPNTITTANNSSQKTGPRGYSYDYKKKYIADSKKMTNAELAKKYGITAKAAWTRTKSWTEQLK